MTHCVIKAASIHQAVDQPNVCLPGISKQMSLQLLLASTCGITLKDHDALLDVGLHSGSLYALRM